MPFDLGDVVPLTVDITDAAGAPANAGAVVLTVTLPDGTTATPSVTNPTTGRYQVDYPTVQAGRHLARWVATGANASAYTDQFDVRPADPGYIVSLADAKAQLNITTTAHDEELRAFIEATTAAIERHTGKVITRRTVTERQSVSYACELWLSQRPVLSVTSIATTDGLTTWPVTSTYMDVNSDWGRLTRLSGNYWTGSLLITYVAGMSQIPSEYTMAARIIVQHLWTTQRGRLGSLRLDAPRVAASEAEFMPVAMTLPRAALELLGPSSPMVA